MARRPRRTPQKKSRLPSYFMAAAVLLVLAVAAALALRNKAYREALSVKQEVKIDTTKGTVVLELYPKLMPVTVSNFIGLAESGFYDGLVWHRAEDWVVQTGDPQGTGYGGSGKTIKLETSPALKNVRGAVGMARSQDPNSASSQFYILKQDASWLDGQYAVFGKVTSGMDVIDKLEKGDRMLRVSVGPVETR